MDNYILYEDDEQRVEIDWRVYNYLKNIYIPHTKPSKEFIKNILLPLIDMLEKNGLKKKDMRVKFCGETPIFQPNKYAAFSKPFDIFETAQAVIVESFDIGENTKEIYDIMLDKYEYLLNEDEELFIPLIFPDTKETYGISGLFIYSNKKEIIIMSWIYREEDDDM